MKAIPDCFQSLLFQVTFGNLILISQKGEDSTGQLKKERVTPITPGYPKARHVQKVAVQNPPAQDREGQRSKGVKCLAGQLVLLNW